MTRTFLLGAGASAEAGLPGSWQLTRQLADRFDTPYAHSRKHLATLNAVAGAVIAYDSARGGSAFDALDIERLFSSVEVLAHREGVELTPFVATWQPGIESVGADLPSFFGKRFMNAVQDDGISGSRVESVFKEGYRALSGGSSGQAFAELREELVLGLREVLKVESDRTEYLKPLVSRAATDSSTIVTLNYDRSIEITATSLGISSNVGISGWPGGISWRWDDEGSADLRVLKLHGSIDWAFEVPDYRQRGLRRTTAVDVLDLDAGERYDRRPPGIVFGQRGKLRSEGPFLAMLVEFNRILDHSDQLVVIGYSFRDAHINSVINAWYQTHKSPSVIIVGPAVPDLLDLHRRSRTKFPEFLVDLLKEVHEEIDWSVNPGGDPPIALKAGHSILRKPAGAAIQELLG